MQNIREVRTFRFFLSVSKKVDISKIIAEEIDCKNAINEHVNYDHYHRLNNDHSLQLFLMVHTDYQFCNIWVLAGYTDAVLEILPYFVKAMSNNKFFSKQFVKKSPKCKQLVEYLPPH